MLTKVYVEGSHFDPDFHLRCSRAAFLRHLAHEIGQPVTPRDEQFEYLPTQVVSEYLAERAEPHLDGIVFRSSQTAEQGRNVVLFNHACGVEPYSLPEGTRIDIDLGWVSEDDYDDTITVFENLPAKRSSKKRRKKPFRPPSFGDLAPDLSDGRENLRDDDCNTRNPMLRLEIDSVQVFHIEGVQYSYRERSVSRYRSRSDQDDKF
jgi:hypothetical protein